nr:Gag-Pol polyprotein [Tanacetum cinerariifolium]
MRAILTKDKCLVAIGERPAEVTDDKWDEMDENVVANLLLALADGVLSSIEEKKTAKDIWNHLARLYEERSLHNKIFLKRKLYALRMKESTSVTEHPLFWKEKIGATIRRTDRKRFADVWLFDTGATFHVTARREWFHQYKSISEGRSVYSCNDHELKIIEIRSIMGKMHDGALVLMKGEKIAANLYQLEGEIIKEAKASVSSHGPSHIVVVSWHQKLRHMSEQGMKILVKKKLIPGLTKVSLPFCKYCVINKQHRLKFKVSNSRSVFVLELVHSDVWQAPVQSLGGAKYFVSFINDYSRRRWVYLIKKKCDVFEVFKVYKARVELDSGIKIKCLRTDNRGEYAGDEFDLFYRQKGIKRQFTTAYTPQQNGVAGHMNKTLLERARAMLATISLGKPFWAEAVNTVCYVINRSPSTAVELKTLMEMWTGKSVYYSDLHIFRSLVYGIACGTPLPTKLLSAEMLSLWKTIFKRMKKHEVNETNESQAPANRTINHERKRPGWHSDYVMESNVAYCLLIEEGEPKPIGNKWVYKIKRNCDDRVERYRARLVVKGYAQKEGIDFNKIFSTVVPMTTVRVVLELCATYGFNLEQLDVKTAFLHGNLDEEIYMLQPEAVPNKDCINKLKAQLAREFEMKDLGLANKILGMQLHRDRVSREIWLSQKSYVKKILKRFNMQDYKPISTPFLTNVKLSSKMSPSSDLDRSKSTTGYVFTLFGGKVSWVSKLQSVVVMSTTEAEYVAAAQAGKEAVWLKMLLEELGHKQEKITLF